jgi:hypothetical protein
LNFPFEFPEFSEALTRASFNKTKQDFQEVERRQREGLPLT